MAALVRLDEVWAFCSARLTEDKFAASRAKAGPWVAGTTSVFLVDNVVYGQSEWPGHLEFACETRYAGEHAVPNVEHIARHDPKRVQRDVAFKRELLAEHEPVLAAAEKGGEVTPMLVCRIDGDDCLFTRGLAALYDDHADYKEAWRP